MEQYHSDFIKNDYFRLISLNINRGAYECIGKGSSRMVYDLENGKVVKVAKNRKGFAQNEVEYRIALDDDSALLANVIATSEEFKFLVMDKANRIEDMSYVWNYFHVRNNQQLFQVQSLKNISSKYNLLFYDLGRAVNWGQINGKPVIIDFGFTRQVSRKYYMPRLLGIPRR